MAFWKEMRYPSEMWAKFKSAQSVQSTTTYIQGSNWHASGKTDLCSDETIYSAIPIKIHIECVADILSTTLVDFCAGSNTAT